MLQFRSILSSFWPQLLQLSPWMKPHDSGKNTLVYVVLLLDVTSYAITRSLIFHNGVLNFFSNSICLGDITGCTLDFLLNELISAVTRFNISIVSRLVNFMNGVSH